MKIRIYISGFTALLFCWLLISPVLAGGDAEVEVIDLLQRLNLDINAAGPFLLSMDNSRSLLIAANTLSSSLTVIDCAKHKVTNIPIGGRGLQHLKSESMFYQRENARVYLIGKNQLHMVNCLRSEGKTMNTPFQFESVAADPETGNAFLAGRECGSIGFYNHGEDKFELIPWLRRSESLTNRNATPPPPIRKVIFDPGLNRVIAVDGFESMMYLFHPRDCRLISSRPLPLTPGGRWHLAGYNFREHSLFIVTETDERKAIQAGRIDTAGEEDTVVRLPGYTECAGINYHPRRNEVYVPYDNHPSLHLVDFQNGGKVNEIEVPAYGNDASALDPERDILYLASWAHGEIDIIDLNERSFRRRITGPGIIPHMFTMEFDQNRELLYFPRGATAVNGTFGSAITALNPRTGETEKIYTGWSPIDIIYFEERESMLIFNSEDQFAEIDREGNCTFHRLPHDYPIDAIPSPEDDIYLSYGPHQSYWPTVYIWDARNGILTIHADDLSFYDRRIPRQSLQLALVKNDSLYFTQNNWGREKQFLGVLPDGVRLFDPQRNIYLGDQVTRETTQRILRYHPSRSRLYLVRTGESPGDPSVLQVIHTDSSKVIAKVEAGQTATDLVFDSRNIYVSNFDSGSVTVIDGNSFESRNIPTGRGPFRLAKTGERIYALNNLDNTIQEISPGNRVHKLPGPGRGDNIFPWRKRLIVTSHSRDSFSIYSFYPPDDSFDLLYRDRYPYGDTSLRSENVSFFMRGQFGDAVFTLTQSAISGDGRLWITDFLSGRVFIADGK